MKLFTARLELREQVESDAEAANVYESDPVSMRYQTSDVRTLEESRAYIAKGIASAKEEPRSIYDFAIVPREASDDRMIGRAGMEIKSFELQEAMIWYQIAPAAQGKGYATEAAARIVQLAFEELGLHRVYADLDPRNVPSRRVCEKLGMRLEAQMIENIFVKGEWCDSLIFAMLAREYRS